MLFKSFRLFVSSTFKDFAQEREVLQTTIFPELNDYCAARGYQFQAVDLRWGVNAEAQLDQQTADICLSEVQAAREYPAPNFLILIGDRYGWVPLPFAIPQDEFDAMVEWLDKGVQREAAGQLARVYKLDENQPVARSLIGSEGFETGAYTLRSRADDLEALKEPAQWEKVETQLRSALQSAADHLLQAGRTSVASHQKYFLSLTEQEIASGLPGYGGRGERASSAQPDAGPQAIVWIKESEQGSSPRPSLLARLLGRGKAEGREEASGEATHVKALVSGIRCALPENCIGGAPAGTDQNGNLDAVYLAKFAEEMKAKLKEAIDRHIARVGSEQHTPRFGLETERATHRAFAEERLKIFVGRDAERTAIASYVSSKSEHPLVVHGSSGAGKSALMARAIADAEAACSAPVIYRFIGGSAGSTNIRLLLVSIAEDLDARGVVTAPENWPDDDDKFAEHFRTFLASIEKPVIIFSDALDQLRRPFSLSWLPDQLPGAVKIVVSVLDDQAYQLDSDSFRKLSQRLPASAFIAIAPLTRADGADILVALERQAKRRLQPEQRAYVVDKFTSSGGLALYLRIAFEIAKRWRSSDTAGSGRYVLADDIVSLIAQFIDQLSTVHHHESELVLRTLGYLSAAKDGLSAKELTDVLSRDAAVMSAVSSVQHGARTTRLPVSVWVRLHRHLAPFLVEKRIDDQPLLQFFHRQVSQVVNALGDARYRAELHRTLAAYFLTDDLDELSARTLEGVTHPKRTLSELPYQLFHAGQRGVLDAILTDPDWMQQKLDAFGPRALVGDYDQFGQSQLQSVIGRTLRVIVGICTRDGRQLLPQLLGRLIGSDAPEAPEFLRRARQRLAVPAILLRQESLAPPGALIARLEGHTRSVRPLAVLPDGRLASGAGDNTVRIWDLETATEEICLVGHTGSIEALAVLPDGRLASSSGDNTIRLWDVRTGIETARLEGHTEAVTLLVPLPEGRLASGSKDHTVRLWDVRTCSEVARLEGHTKDVSALVLLPDGRLASSSSDNTIRLWDLTTGTETNRLEGHTSSVLTLLLLPDGRLASSSFDNTLRLWDVKTGTQTASLEARSDENRLIALPGGRIASCAADYSVRLLPDDSIGAGPPRPHTIHIWDAGTGEEIMRLAGHTASIRAMILLSDGRLASCSNDRTVRIWDTHTGEEGARLDDHAEGVMALIEPTPGRLVTGSHDGLRLWDLAVANEARRNKHHEAAVLALAVLPGERIASTSGSNPEVPKVWANALGFGSSDSNDGVVTIRSGESAVEVVRLEGHSDAVSSIVPLSTTMIVTGSYDKTVRVWDTERGEEITQVVMDLAEDGQSLHDEVRAVAVLSDLRVAAAVQNDIRLFNLKSGEEITRLVGHTDRVYAIVVVSDRFIITASADQTIKVWDLEAGAEMKSLSGHTGGVRAMVLLPGGRLVSGSDDKTVRVWNILTGAEMLCIGGLSGEVRAVAAVPGNRIVAGVRDHTVRAWDLETGRELCRLEIDGSVTCLAALEDGCFIGGDDLGNLHHFYIAEDSVPTEAEPAIYRGHARSKEEFSASGAAPAPYLSSPRESDTTYPPPGSGREQWFKDFDFGPEMVVVPAGEFLMGGSTLAFEKPVHKVTIPRPFAVGRFPITCEEWDAAVSDYVRENGKAHFVRVRGAERKGKQPAGGVSWFDARFYTMWISERTGLPYRLLSEAEWEYCCRAGTTTDFSFGDTITKAQANMESEETVPVGSFAPNAFGLYDMHGSVSEWVEDVWHDNYAGAPDDGSPWVDIDFMDRIRTAPDCIQRGGSCFGSDLLLKSSFRLRCSPSEFNYDIGLRVARML